MLCFLTIWRVKGFGSLACKRCLANSQKNISILPVIRVIPSLFRSKTTTLDVNQDSNGLRESEVHDTRAFLTCTSTNERVAPGYFISRCSSSRQFLSDDFLRRKALWSSKMLGAHLWCHQQWKTPDLHNWVVCIYRNNLDKGSQRAKTRRWT